MVAGQQQCRILSTEDTEADELAVLKAEDTLLLFTDDAIPIERFGVSDHLDCTQKVTRYEERLARVVLYEFAREHPIACASFPYRRGQRGIRDAAFNGGGEQDGRRGAAEVDAFLIDFDSQ